MSEENNEHQEKKEYITEEINTDMANIQYGEQIQDEENGMEGEEYNMEEGGEEEGEYNIEDGGEEGEYNIEDGEEEGQEFQVMNQEGNYNPEDGQQEGEEEGEEEVGEEQIVEDGEQNNDQQIQNENEEIENEENNQLNQEQEEHEDDDQNELVDYQNNIENADNNEHIEENNFAYKEEVNKEENKLEINSNKEESETKIEENKGLNLINSKKVLKPSKQMEQTEQKEEGQEEGKEGPKKEDIETLKVEQPQIELKENTKEAKEIPSENLNIIKPKDEIKTLEKKDEKNKEENKEENIEENKEENKNIIQKEKKEAKTSLQKPEKQEKKEEEIKWSRHVFHSDETNPNESNLNDKRYNYQFHCTVVTKKKQPSAAPIPKKFSKPVSKPTNTKYTQNQQAQNTNTRDNVINTTNIKPKTPTQTYENKRKANPITIQTKYDNKRNEPKKYEPKKYEPPKQAKPANTSYIINISHNRPQIQKPIHPQPQKSYKKTEIKISTQTQNKYQQKKPEYSRITIDRSKISSSNQNKRSNNQQIFNSRTSKETPKLKYYVRCPNCGYHLNDESAVNNYNRANGSYNSSFINKRENYENKSYLRTAIKDKGKGIISHQTNSNNYRRNIDYSQKTNVKYSVKNLQKNKDFTPSNITYYESYGTSKKTRHGTNP